MAQHHELDLVKEKEVRRSIARIGDYIAKSACHIGLNTFQKKSIYAKEVTFLPKEYYSGICSPNLDCDKCLSKLECLTKGKKDCFVVSIFPYDLKRTRIFWGDYWKTATLECHFDNQGNILKAYYPL